MTPRKMLQTLVKQGYSQVAIAKLLNNRGHKCNQSQISRILGGGEPTYQLGHAIRLTYFDVMDPKPSKDAAQ